MTTLVQDQDIDKKEFPTREGVYVAKGLFQPGNMGEIEVRFHPKRGLCCNANSYSNVRDFSKPIPDSVAYTDYEVPVSWTGLEFISRVGDLLE